MEQASGDGDWRPNLKPEHQILNEGAPIGVGDDDASECTDLNVEHRSKSETTTRASAFARGDKRGEWEIDKIRVSRTSGRVGNGGRCASVPLTDVYTCACMEADQCKVVHFSRVGSCLHHGPHM